MHLAKHQSVTLLFAALLIFTCMYFYLYTVSTSQSPKVSHLQNKNSLLMHGRLEFPDDPDANSAMSVDEEYQTIKELAKLLKEAIIAAKGLNGSLDKSAITTKRKESVPRGNILPKAPTSLLTLFTSCSYSAQLELLYNNTFRNWASFAPAITPVLFTNNTKLKDMASKYGWASMAISKSKGDYPVLKNMYADVKKAVDSKFYGYVNADILFNDGLIKTLVSLMYDKSLNISDDTPLMITGQRWNVMNVTSSDVTLRRNIDVIRQERGSLFQSSAEDYFITNKAYPWKELPDLVIGCPGIDNFLVIHGRSKNYVLLDATATIPVVHQSSNPNPYLSHSRNMSTYNIELLQNIYKSVMPWPRGFTDCIYRYTADDADKIVVKERLSPAYCAMI